MTTLSLKINSNSKRTLRSLIWSKLFVTVYALTDITLTVISQRTLFILNCFTATEKQQGRLRGEIIQVPLKMFKVSLALHVLILIKLSPFNHHSMLRFTNQTWITTRTPFKRSSKHSRIILIQPKVAVVGRERLIISKPAWSGLEVKEILRLSAWR